MGQISLDQANAIIAGTLANGAELGLQPLSVAVLDPGGHPIAFARQDGSSIMRFQIACGKAAGALALGISSRNIAAVASERPTFIASLGQIAQHGIIPAAGGVIIVNDSDRPIGAVGVTGDTSDNDEACALAGIAAAGLAAQS